MLIMCCILTYTRAILELSRYNAAESGWDEQIAYRYKPVDIWEMDQIDWYVQNTGDPSSDSYRYVNVQIFLSVE